ncbi:hypothetical protein H4R20_001202 [Coemansia guatemalensis]|uniref:Neuroguidin n=1 Tax=Coemansia guatemalensis TaxID=2761395 RepID=A0A9W8LV55_9FUNG|nr:hypothetical protein H4R20_001202 [Coemansia guatemalensis]
MERREINGAVDSRLDAMRTQADQVRQLVDKLRQRVEDGELTTGSGLSFLETKHHTMLSYISELAYIAVLKLYGQQLEGHPVVQRLIEDRLVLEKMRPLEQRLRYQIDKLLRNAVVSADNSSAASAKAQRLSVADTSAKLAATMLRDDAMADPSAFRPNPGSLEVDVREEDARAIESGIYRAPKQTPVHYEEDTTQTAKREREEQRMAERASRSRLVRDLMVEYDDRPEMSTASGNPSVGITDARMERLAEEKARYEEENFTRLAVGRKERKGMRKRLAGLEDEFAHLNDFAGAAALRKSAEASASKTAVLDRIGKKRRENESTAERVMRRRNGRRDDDDDVLQSSAARNPKRGRFQTAKRRIAKR